MVLNGFGDSAPAIKAVTASAASAGAGGKVAFVDADLLSEGGVQHLAKASVDALGHIDIIVNNAGEWWAVDRWQMWTFCAGPLSPFTHLCSLPVVSLNP